MRKELTQCRHIFVAIALTSLSSFIHAAQTFDGAQNNPLRPNWACTGCAFRRLADTPNSFADGRSQLQQHATNPRVISNTLFKIDYFKYNSASISHMNAAWGQFLAHDLAMTTPGPAESNITVPVPECDAVMDFDCNGKRAFTITRTNMDTSQTPAAVVNSASGYLDASTVYGQTRARAHLLRRYIGGQVLSDPTVGAPANIHGQTQAGHTPATQQRLTGDIRGNNNPGLLALHGLFMLEHNRVARQLQTHNPTWNDEKLFQEARKRVIATIQSITYNEYLPALLGTGLPAYSGYNSLENAAPSLLFAIAAYRYGHTGLNAMYWRFNDDGTPFERGHLLLRDVYFKPHAYLDDGLAPIFRGLVVQPEKDIGLSMVDDARNFVDGLIADLAAIDIVRGRDVGLPSYVDARRIMGLTPPERFEDITDHHPTILALTTAYNGNLSEVDVWVGGLAEPHVPGALVGELFFEIIRRQFMSTRAGDRYWFENEYPEGEKEGRAFSTEELSTLRSTRLSDVIRRNIPDLAESYPDAAFRVAPHYGRAGSSTGSGSSSASNQGSSGGGSSSPPADQSADDTDTVVDGDARHTVAIGEHIQLRWKPPALDEDSITMEVTLMGTGWSAFGIGSGMSDADIIIMRVIDDVVDVKDTSSNAYTMPTLDPSQDVEVISGQETDGKTVVTWRRKLNTGDRDDKPLVRGAKTQLMFAWSTSSDTVAPHGANRLRTSLDFFQPIEPSSGNSTDASTFEVVLDLEVDDSRLKSFRFHGVSMFAMWGVIVPIGAMISRFLKSTGVWLNFHKWSMMLAVTITLPAAGAALVSSGGSAAAAHAALAGILSVGMVAETILGAVSRHWLRSSTAPPIRAFFTAKLIHKALGWLLVLAGLGNCYVGVTMLAPSLEIPMLVYAGLFIAATLCLTIYREITQTAPMVGSTGATDIHSIALSRSSKAISIGEMRESIRNGCKWVVLGGRVYDVSAYMKMHPGGAYLIERYVGQDITAVFFGRESAGLNIPIHAHSVAAHKALSKCLIGVMKTATDRRSWVDDVNFGDADEWTLKTRKMVIFGTHPILKLVFHAPHARASPALRWNPHSFGRFMQVQLPTQARSTLKRRISRRSAKGLDLEDSSSTSGQPSAMEERSYTIVRQDNKAGLVLYVRKYPDGLVSPAIHRLREGDKVRMRGPQGLGLYLEDDDDGIVVGIAQGTGIFAFFDMIQHLVAVARNARETGRPARIAWPSAITTPVSVEEATKDPVQAVKQAASLLTHVKSELDFERFSMGGRKRSHRISSNGPGESASSSPTGRLHKTNAASRLDGLSELCTVVQEQDLESNDSDALSTLACEESDEPSAHQQNLVDANPFDALKSIHGAQPDRMPPKASRNAKVRPMMQDHVAGDGVPNEKSTPLASPYQTYDGLGSANQQSATPGLRRDVQDSSCTSPMTTASDSTANTRPPGYLRLVLMVCVRDEQSVPELDWLREMEKECDEFELHINVRHTLGRAVNIQGLTQGYLTPARLAKLLPQQQLLSVAVCGSPVFTTTVTGMYKAMGVPPGMLTAL